jgi:undecaprenyl pyrophosphate phosphatase UppP
MKVLVEFFTISSTGGALVLKHFMPIRIDKQPVTAASWQHGSQICFATFNLQKFSKLLITQLPLKLEKKIKTDWKSSEFFIKNCWIFDKILHKLPNKFGQRFLVTT